MPLGSGVGLSAGVDLWRTHTFDPGVYIKQGDYRVETSFPFKWDVIVPTVVGAGLGFLGGSAGSKLFLRHIIKKNNEILTKTIPDNLGLIPYYEINPDWISIPFKVPEYIMKEPPKFRYLMFHSADLPESLPSIWPGYKFIYVIDGSYRLVKNEFKTTDIKWIDFQYINQLYPADHWALDNTKEGTCIAFIKFRKKENYAVKLNPTDRRGYRVLITFIGEDNTDIQTTFNRPYTVSEERGLA